MQQVVEDLKGRPNDEKKAVAGSVAIFVVTILFIGWGFFFFKKIAGGGEVAIPFGGVRQDVIQGATLQRAGEDFMKSYNDATADMKAIRDQGVSDQGTYSNDGNSASFNEDFSAGSTGAPSSF